jgi:hypothetical protein
MRHATGMAIPACWPQHPHLVHEIVVLADQRRRAGHALTSDASKEWHRYSLPAFIDGDMRGTEASNLGRPVVSPTDYAL